MFFDPVTEAPPDAIFGLSAAFQRDPRAEKVNLSVGVYKTPDLKTAILDSVKRAEELLIEKELTKEYLPINGDPLFLEEVGALVFGTSFWQKERARCALAQVVGGTGGLRVGGDFIKRLYDLPLYLPDPTWPNHKGVFSRCGFEVRSYPYYDQERNRVDFEKLYDFFQRVPEKSVIVLHAVCHNPTGADLTHEQWKELSTLFQRRNLFPFFDLAYQGFDRGLGEDAASVRLFAEAGHEMLVSSSCSKNFTLYSERVGALFLMTGSEKKAKEVESQIKNLIRTNYSNPPRHGASIVATILRTASLREQWELELTSMRERIVEMRRAFAKALMARASRFAFLEEGKGLFSFCGLNKEQVDRIIEEKGVYMTADGRVNVAGLNWENLDYVVNAILAVL